MKKLSKTKAIVYLSILLSALCMMLSYPWMSKQAESTRSDTVEMIGTSRFLDDVLRTSYSHYYELKKLQTPALKPYELFIDESENEVSTQYAQEITDIILNQKEEKQTKQYYQMYNSKMLF